MNIYGQWQNLQLGASESRMSIRCLAMSIFEWLILRLIHIYDLLISWNFGSTSETPDSSFFLNFWDTTYTDHFIQAHTFKSLYSALRALSENNPNTLDQLSILLPRDRFPWSLRHNKNILSYSCIQLNWDPCDAHILEQILVEGS